MKKVGSFRSSLKDRARSRLARLARIRIASQRYSWWVAVAISISGFAGTMGACDRHSPSHAIQNAVAEPKASEVESRSVTKMSKITALSHPQEGPYSSVPVEFYIDENEVTVAQYRQCVEQRGCNLTAPDQSHRPGERASFCNWGRSDRENHPINCVGPLQAALYCDWVDKRLPTLSEWNWAAYQSDEKGSVAYPWGDEEFDEAHPQENLQQKGEMYGTMPIRSFPPSKANTLYDMAGNVSEWTNSREIMGSSWGSSVSYARRGGESPPSALLGSTMSGFRCANDYSH